MYNFRTVMGKSSYKAWKNWDIGDYVVGTFQSQGEDNYNNPTYKLEVIESNFEEAKAGEIFTLNSNGSLNKAMEDVAVGSIVKVIYKGEETVTKGKFKGKNFHALEVLVADAQGNSVKTTSNEDEEIL